MSKSTKKTKKKCKTGWQCGLSCISKKKSCRKNIKSTDGKSILQRYINLAKAASNAVPLKITPSGGGGGGGGGASDPKEASLKQIEDDIVKNNFETGVAVDKKGQVVWMDTGGAVEVNIRDLLTRHREDLPNLTLTHNHPDRQNYKGSEGLTLDGGSFSPSDIATAIAHNLGGIRAVSRDFIHEMKRKEGNKNYVGDGDVFATTEAVKSIMTGEFTDLDDQIFASMKDSIDQKLAANREKNRLDFSLTGAQVTASVRKITATAGLESLHQTNAALAEKYGYEYTRTPRNK